MKLSNKLIIAFAASLILIPVLGMVFVSTTQYKTGTYKDIVYKVEDFKTPTKNMSSISIPTAFTAINIADAKGMILSIQLIKDEKFGIKIPEEYKDLINATVDANGQLQITVKDKLKEENNRGRYYTNIYVYAPTVNALTIANAGDINIMATADSLTLNATKADGISFGSETHIKQLNIKTTDVERLSFRQDDIKSINLDLHNTKLNSEDNSFDNVSIATSGNCTVEISGGYDDQKVGTIKNLVLNTTDKAIVNLENMQVTNCSGKLSDQTQVQMPALNLNQMYKK